MHGHCVIGRATRGLELAAHVTLSRDDRRRHLHIIGKTGVGKSTLLKAMLHHDLANGESFALLDPLGGVAESVVDAVPKSRNDEAIYFDPSDMSYPVGFNPLDRVPVDRRDLAAQHVMQAFLHIWGGNFEETPRLIYVLYNGLRLLLDSEGATLLGLPRLLVDDRYRERLIAQCQDQAVVNYWRNEFAAYDDRFRTQVISPIQNKVGMLLAPPTIRNILGQRRSTIDIARLMNGGGIFVANLAKGKIGATSAHLLGALLATTFAQVAEQRIAIPLEQRRDFTLYCDEVQNFSTDSFASLLSEARNWRLSIVAAHQFMSQIPHQMQQALTGNCGTTICFRVGAEDARVLARELDIDNSSALSNAANFTAWTRMLKDGAPTDPFLLETIETGPPDSGRAAAVIAHTRARHTRERASVQRQIAGQLEG